MKRPRVLFLTTAYPTPDLPVAGVFVREHALAAAEHADVAVLHLDRREGATARLRVEPLPDEPLPAWRVSYPYRPLPLSVLAHYVAAGLGYRQTRFAPDLIHAHFFLAGVPAVLLGRLARVPVVVTEQWSIFLPSDPMPLTAPLRLSAGVAFGGAQLVLPPSEALRNGIEAAGLHPPMRVVPNVVDTGLFHPAPSAARPPRRLLAVGLLYDAKGYEFLLEAVSLLERDVELRIAGDGPLRAALQQQVDELGIGDRVTFLGLVDKPDVAELMRWADAFVLASRYDNNPSVLIEALASGLPVVATDVGGIPELVDPQSGLLARAQDAPDLARRIGELLDGYDRYDRAGIAARAERRFGRAAVGAALADVYRTVLEGARR